MNTRANKVLCSLTITMLIAGAASSCSNRSAVVVNVDKNTMVESNFELQSFNDLSQQVLALKQNYKKSVLSFSADSSAQVASHGIKYYLQGEPVEGRNSSFNNKDAYSDLPGVTAFRGNNMRDGGSYGTADIKEGKLELLWRKKLEVLIIGQALVGMGSLLLCSGIKM